MEPWARTRDSTQRDFIRENSKGFSGELSLSGADNRAGKGTEEKTVNFLGPVTLKIQASKPNLAPGWIHCLNRHFRSNFREGHKEPGGNPNP